MRPDTPLTATTTERPPRPAATLTLVRDGAQGLEVLLLQRADRGDHNSNAWVFPGGLIDADDARAAAWVDGLDDAQASARLGLPAGGLAAFVAAVRESFEEADLLLTRGARPAAAVLADWRGALQRGDRSIAAFCEATGLRLDLSALRYVAHWVTPPGRAKRFDTRFFLARAPHDQAVAHDGGETVAHRWMRPADALAQGDALKLLTPTRSMLAELARHASVAAAWAWADGLGPVRQTMPCMGQSQHGERPVTPDEPAYAELLKLDPGRTGTHWCELRPGQPVALSTRVIRVTAHNGSLMTGPGTNTYLVGPADPAAHASGDWAVIDPGPDDARHVEAILAAAPGPIRWIFATHTHLDHSPACALLQARTGATVMGRIADHPQWQDPHFRPDRLLTGGERLALAPGSTLAVVHTPGHASNHLCYWLEEEGMLFTGDHVMQRSTVVINPPDGDMAAYLRSMRALLDLPLQWLAPGHGFLMDEPRAAMQAVIDHRLRREAKVLAALHRLAPVTDEALLAAVYDDVPPKLHPMALRSLAAHLGKLREEGACHRDGDAWRI